MKIKELARRRFFYFFLHLVIGHVCNLLTTVDKVKIRVTTADINQPYYVCQIDRFVSVFTGVNIEKDWIHDFFLLVSKNLADHFTINDLFDS